MVLSSETLDLLTFYFFTLLLLNWRSLTSDNFCFDFTSFAHSDSHTAVLPPLYLISYFPESGDKVVIVGFL